ncbi:MAG TPA: hypothetical protein VG621_01310 [Candidatus Paceibacterota bacterium]|nr:hypothetical protein [Candidatus Paceibacterota bacterium]
MKETFPISKGQETPTFSKREIEFLDNEVQTMKKGALIEDDFRGKEFSDEFVDQCKKEVEKIKEGFEKDNKISEMKSEIEENFALSKEYRQASEYLEALFYNKLGGRDGWIPNALVWKTSEYDDYVNGIDFVVESEDRELALGTDVTFSHSRALVSKLNRIKKQIDTGELPQLTFYDPVKMTDRPLPRAVIAVEREKIIKALKLWADSEHNEGFEHLLRNHPLRAKTMLELEMQLESFAVYAKNIGRREIASSYNDLLSQIQLLIIDHEETIKNYRELIDDDLAYQTIASFCESLKNTKNFEN